MGAAAVFVPFPSAVDDHQTTNARFLVDAGAGWLLPQAEATPQALARLLSEARRPDLLARADKARAQARLEAVQAMVQACEELTA